MTQTSPSSASPNNADIALGKLSHSFFRLRSQFTNTLSLLDNRRLLASARVRKCQHNVARLEQLRESIDTEMKEHRARAVRELQADPDNAKREARLRARYNELKRRSAQVVLDEAYARDTVTQAVEMQAALEAQYEDRRQKFVELSLPEAQRLRKELRQLEEEQQARVQRVYELYQLDAEKKRRSPGISDEEIRRASQDAINVVLSRLEALQCEMQVLAAAIICTGYPPPVVPPTPELPEYHLPTSIDTWED